MVLENEHYIEVSITDDQGSGKVVVCKGGIAQIRIETGDNDSAFLDVNHKELTSIRDAINTVLENQVQTYSKAKARTQKPQS